jgi:hypothetical protein
LKIVYIEVLEPLFGFPAFTSTSGRLHWAILSPLYWVLGFVVAAAIPQLSFISGLVAAIFGGGFTYILPALAAVAFWSRRDAILPEEQFNPTTGIFNYADTGMRRYSRGFMRRPWFNLFNFTYFLAGLVACGLGCYAAVTQLIAVFQSGVTTSFTCKSPV